MRRKRLHAAAIASLRDVLAFVKSDADPRRFLLHRITERDGGAWIGGQKPHDVSLQAEVRELLNALVQKREPETTVRAITFGLKQHGDSIVVTRAGSQRDLFLYALIRRLEQVGIDKLRVCQARDRKQASGVCGRMFLKVTRKEFCSARCQSREYMRSYAREGTTDRKQKRRRVHGKRKARTR